MAQHRDRRGHVYIVNVRPLFTIYLDTHERFVEMLGDFNILKRLPLHHVAPVTRAIPNRHQHRYIAAASLGKRLLTPRIPINRVLRMLKQIRRRLCRESIGHAER